MDESPRPAKRRRVAKSATKATSAAGGPKRKPGRPKKNANVVPQDGASDSDAPLRPAKKRTSKARSASVSSGTCTASDRRARTPKPKKSKQRTTSPPSDISDDAFEPVSKVKALPRAIRVVDYDEEDLPKQKKPKHRIHEPTDSTLLIDRFISGSQIPPSSDPDSIRGPIWIQRPLPAVPAPRPITKPPVPIPKFSEPKPQFSQPSVLAVKPVSFNNIALSRRENLAPSTDAIAKPATRAPGNDSRDSPALENDGIGMSRAGSLTPAAKDLRGTTNREPISKTGSIGSAKKNSGSPTRHAISATPAKHRHVGESSMIGLAESAASFVRPSSGFAEDVSFDGRPGGGGTLHQPMISVASSRTVSKESGSTVTSASTEHQLACFDIADELADLPSDAFCSSPEPESPVLARSTNVPERVAHPNGLGTGYRQMTLHGSLSGPKDAQQTKAKKVAKPIMEKQEPPTQHKLNEAALSTWVYPVNLGTVRDYQYNIVQAGMFKNLLVALPTGLGKTFIAATIMLNWFRWTKDAQIIFVAPTKPLVAQQIEACFQTVGIPRSETAMLTGEVGKTTREDAWKEKRVFFCTPQTVEIDLSNGACDPKRIVLLVIDEAHRATGKYAYVKIVSILRRYNQSFRVLALTATPGKDVQTVQGIIDNLDIAKTEIRSETSMDIRSYVHSRDLETFSFGFSDEQEMIMDLFSKALQSNLDKLKSQNATWMTNPRKISAFGLTQACRQWMASEAGKNASQGLKGMIRNCFQVLASLAHAMTMIKFHGIGPFYRKIIAWRNEMDGTGRSTKAAKEVRENPNFDKMCNFISTWIKNPDFVGHPKLEHLRSVILNHFLDRGETGLPGAPSATRVMVFAQYRDSAEEICRVLRRNEPMIRPRVFVGQAHADGSVGMNQKAQLEAINQFKAGTFNTLVATSIGEEGLDIGEVDLIVCYDASASPIRMLQRMGRTGRKRQGNIVLLLMKEKEEADFASSKDNYEKMQGMIEDGKYFQYHDDRSPRILPKGIKPVVDKRVVEIPTENSQADLPIPRKSRARTKKAPKKFHMPDNVITGFVKASRVRGDGSEAEISGLEDNAARPKKTGKRKSLVRTKSNVSLPRPEPEAIPLPFLDDVLLNRMQERELERKYQSVASAKEAAVVQAPMPEKNLAGFQRPCPVVKVQHSRLATSVALMLDTMHNTDGSATEYFNEHLHMSDIEDPTLAEHLYGDPNIDHFPEPEADLSAEDAANAESDSDTLSAAPVPPPKKRGRPAKPKTPAAPKRKAPAKATAAPKPRASAAKGRGRPALQRNSSAMEAASSSPPPTPADMRLPSQGIALGEEDTSGDDAPEGTNDWMHDSDLDGFVVGSDEEIEFASSSLPYVRGDSTPGVKKATKQAKKGRTLGGAKSAAAKARDKRKELEKEKMNGGRGELSKEFIYDSDEEDEIDVDAEESDDMIMFDPAANEGISATKARGRRRVIESSSEESDDE
ncbi:hypothetical protein BDZ85DRAFT_317557 [Elsinoe ampelina]|uniref:ATP-dependent DNA helicase n=1 Tax=Elsinoe ampelina TaxID=302913 RepID=A0A6A6GGX1_9PEZI|nr:hypothetical protein BDZ85DRAFT_317557 [Elsinoe ampelina]